MPGPAHPRTVRRPVGPAGGPATVLRRAHAAALVLLGLAAATSCRGALAPDDQWCHALGAQVHRIEPDATGQWHWHLYARDSNATASVFHRRPGPGTEQLWLGDGHRPVALPPLRYAADVQPRPLAVACDGSQVLVALEAPDAHGMPQDRAIEVLTVHPGPDQVLAGQIALPTPAAVREACILPGAMGGGIVLLVGERQQHLERIDVHQHVTTLARTPGQVATLTLVPRQRTLWVSDEQGVHAVDIATGAVHEVLARGEDDFPRYVVVFTPALDRAVVVRWGAHSNRVTLTAVTLATGATTPLPGSVTTENGVCLLRRDRDRFLLAEGLDPMHTTGVVWSVGFAHGEIHREP